MSAIDHKTEAEKIATVIETGGRDRALYVAEAQLHATLYLAEQQRIANLIAFLSTEGSPYKLINNMRGAQQEALAVIREGLGLS